jgi:hypothetical protein
MPTSPNDAGYQRRQDKRPFPLQARLQETTPAKLLESAADDHYWNAQDEYVPLPQIVLADQIDEELTSEEDCRDPHRPPISVPEDQLQNILESTQPPLPA